MPVSETAVKSAVRSLIWSGIGVTQDGEICITSDIALKIINARHNPLSEMISLNADFDTDESFSALAMLAGRIMVIARANGARKEIDEATCLIMAQFVLNHFSQLCVNSEINEINTAFELCNAGKISVDTTVWGGEFNVSLLGKVLSAYVKYRKKILDAYDESNEKENLLKIEAEKKNTPPAQTNERSITQSRFDEIKSRFWELVQTNKRKEIDCQSRDIVFPFWIFDDLYTFWDAMPKIPKEVVDGIRMISVSLTKSQYEADALSPDKKIAEYGKEAIELLSKGEKPNDYQEKCKHIFDRYRLMYFVENWTLINETPPESLVVFKELGKDIIEPSTAFMVEQLKKIEPIYKGLNFDTLVETNLREPEKFKDFLYAPDFPFWIIQLRNLGDWSEVVMHAQKIKLSENLMFKLLDKANEHSKSLSKPLETTDLYKRTQDIYKRCVLMYFVKRPHELENYKITD